MVTSTSSPKCLVPPKADWPKHAREAPKERRETEGTSDEGSIGSHPDSTNAVGVREQVEKVTEAAERVGALQNKAQTLIRQLERGENDTMPPPPPPVSQTTHRKKAVTPTAGCSARRPFCRTTTDRNGTLTGRSSSSDQARAAVATQDDDAAATAVTPGRTKCFSKIRPPAGPPSKTGSGKKPTTPPSSRRGGATPTSFSQAARSKGFEAAALGVSTAAIPSGLPHGLKDRDVSGNQPTPTSGRKLSGSATPTAKRGAPGIPARRPSTPTASSATYAKNVALAISTLNQQPEKSALKRSNSSGRVLERRTVGICDENGEISIPGVPLGSSASLSSIHTLYSGGSTSSSERVTSSRSSMERPAAHARVPSESPILPPDEYADALEGGTSRITSHAKTDAKMLEALLVENIAMVQRAGAPMLADDARRVMDEVVGIMQQSLELSVTYYQQVLAMLQALHAQEVAQGHVEEVLGRLHATLPSEEAVSALARYLSANADNAPPALLLVLLKLFSELLDAVTGLSQNLAPVMNNLQPVLIDALCNGDASLRKRVIFIFVSMYRSFGPDAALPFLDRLQINQIKLCHVYLKRAAGCENVDLLFEVTEYRANNGIDVIDIP